jgi:protein gp37
MPIMPNPDQLRTRPPFSDLWPIDPRVQTAITEDMAYNGFDASKPIDVWREPDAVMTVIDGHTRLQAAIINGLAVAYFEHDFADEDEALEYAIKTQRDRRNLTDADLLHLVEMLDSRRQAGRPKLAQPCANNNKSSRETADLLGVSSRKVEQTRTVLDNAPEPIKAQVAAGQMTINHAYNEVRAIRQYGEALEELRPRIDTAIAETDKKMTVARFNRTNDNIEWAQWSWNPVTGCKYGCSYCYARDIANRFYAEKFEPTFHPERLTAPHNTPCPSTTAEGARNVFVCSMADLFGPWVPQEWIDAVLKAVRSAPQWTFIFLTKNPARLAEIDWPDNAWVGATVDTQVRVKPTEDAFRNVEATVKFVSIEPFRERITFSWPDLFNWFIIGGQSATTGEGERQPEWEWVEGVVNQARAVNAMVYFKPNLKARPREFPE